MVTAFVWLALAAEPVSVGFRCDGFAAVDCRAWSRHFTEVLTDGQRVQVQADAKAHIDAAVTKRSGHACDVSLTLARPGGEPPRTFNASVDYKERVDHVLEAAALEFRGQLTFVPRSPQKVAVLLGAAEVGLALSVIGSVLYGISQADAGLLSTDFPQTAGQVSATAAQGRTFQPAGATLLGIGLAVIAGALAWLILGATP